MDRIHRIWQQNLYHLEIPKVYLVAVFLLLFAALFKMTTDDLGAKPMTAMMALGSVLFVVYGKTLRRSPIVVFLILAVFIQLATWLLVKYQVPELSEKSLRINRLLPWFMMIPVAFLIGGSVRNILVLWGCVALGLILAPWVSGGGFDELHKGLFRRLRVDYGLNNAQHTGMLFGVLLIASIAFFKRVFMPSGPIVWWQCLLWLGLFIASLATVLISQTRGIWLGLIAVTMVAVLGALIGALKYPKYRYKVLGIMTASVMLLYLLLSMYGEPIQKRLNAEKNNIENIIQGKDYDASTSIGIRVASWEHALVWIKERPVFGWGWKGRNAVLQDAPKVPKAFKKQARHLHSSYIDLLVNYGIAGLVVMLALFAYLWIAAFQAWKGASIPTDIFVFFSSFGVYWLVVNAFESYMLYSSGKFVFTMVCGGVLSLIWLDKVKKQAHYV